MGLRRPRLRHRRAGRAARRRAARPRPDRDAPVSSFITLYVEDADALHARAIEAGATEINPVADHVHGDRAGSVRDPFGHRWAVATHIEDVTPEEMERRMKEMA